MTLIGPDHPVFTAFGQPNPERVIIDLSATSDQALAPVMVNDGLVSEVSVSPYSVGTGSDMTRVEVMLEAPAEHQVEMTPGGLQVRISAGRDTAAFDTSADWAGELHLWISYHFQGIDTYEAGRYRDAETLFAEAEKETCDEHRLAFTLDGKGMTYLALGRYSDAEACLEKALCLREEEREQRQYAPESDIRSVVSGE